MSITAKAIIESIPDRFRAEKAEGYSTIVHIDLTGLAYTVEINAGECFLKEGLHGTAVCKVESIEQNYVALETGELNPQWALMSGKVKVSNLAEMMRFTKCFRRFDGNAATQKVVSGVLKFAERPTLEGPLKGVRILDFTRLLPGPIATMFLAQQGAEVIKIEDPDSPDYIRSFEPQVNGESVFYLALNSNKKSLAVNYLSDEGRSIIKKLVAQADVLMEQFRPGVMEKFGLGYEDLKSVNPKLIYVSVTGYGSTSSKANHAGHDLNYIAQSGLPFITGAQPTLPGFQAADVAGGAYMAMNAVTTALFERERTGRGSFVNVAMTDCVLPLMALPLAAQQLSDSEINTSNFELAGSIANYNIYECSDGKFIALGALEPKFWNAFCEAVNQTDWKNKLLAGKQEMQKLIDATAALFKTKSRNEWLEFLKNTDCCITPVNDLREVWSDRYLNEQELFIEHQHARVGNFKTLRHPLQFQSSNFAQRWSAPDLGEDTTSVLKTAGLSDEEIRKLYDGKKVR